jgi:hypothetical protein
MLTSSTCIATIAIVGSWIAGGILLRTGGLIAALLGALDLAINHNPAGIALLAIGLVAWLVGHWHYALRHHHYKSPLAQRILSTATPRPTRSHRRLGIPGNAGRTTERPALTPPVPGMRRTATVPRTGPQRAGCTDRSD